MKNPLLEAGINEIRKNIRILERIYKSYNNKGFYQAAQRTNDHMIGMEQALEILTFIKKEHHETHH